MDIYHIGHACFKIKGKTATIVIDPFDPDSTGLKLPKDLEADMVLVTHGHGDHNYLAGVGGSPVVVSGPGEYDIKGVAITGVQTYHDSEKGSSRGRNTVYHLSFEGLNLVHLGDLGHTLTQEQIEEIGTTNILFVPVGGVYTIDAKEAVEVVAAVEPSITIPMHYGGDPNLKYQLGPLDDFLKEMGKEGLAPQAKLTITKEKLPEEPQVVVLE